MGYLHIENLYRNKAILMFKECWALEKIHGTSAHISWREGQLTFFAGGSKHDSFLALFDANALTAAFVAIGYPEVTVYGEAYGGKINAQSWRYGKDLRFVAFEAKIGETWLGVENAADVAGKLGLEFVHFRRILAQLDSIDAERDAPSEQAWRNGMGDHPREGVVLKPLVEATLNGHRVIAKHKRDEERETKTERTVTDLDGFEVLCGAEQIATEWVTPTRLQHVLDHLGGDVRMERTPEVIAAMTEDVLREGAGEIVDSKEARKAIGRETVAQLKRELRRRLEAAV